MEIYKERCSMDKWKEVLSVYKNNEKYVKAAAIILILIAALVFFGEKGEKEIVVTQDEEKIQAEAQADIQQDDNSIGTRIVVDISGSVKKPGVYEVEEGARLYQVIEQAGGLLENADITAINQAEILYDGQKIIVAEKITDGDGNEKGGLPKAVTEDGKVNINLADQTELQQIPGVGPATAEKIIQYRESQGRFRTIEDIQNVNGIGQKTFEKLKDMIIV